MATSNLYPARESLALQSPFQLCAFLLVFSIVFQKFAVPGLGGVVALTLVVLSGVAAHLVINGVLAINSAALPLAIMFLASTAVSVSLSRSAQTSIPSWLFLLVTQVPLVLRMAPDRDFYADLLRFTSLLGAITAVFGVAQAVLQNTVGSDTAFWLDYHIPTVLALKGYNNLNQFSWDVSGFKSNGVFFSEPSIFCQFLGICVLAELSTAARPMRLALLAAGLLTSYSGTGLMMLAFFLVFYIPRAQRLPIIMTIVVFLLLVAAGSEVLQLKFITSRIDEFTSPNTSGYARFVAHFDLIDEVLSKDTATLLFGRGPGTISEFYNTRPFEICPPTYAKVIYEYGAVGIVLYLTFFYVAILRRGAPLCWPIAFTYFTLGGYLQDAAFMVLLLVLGGWSKQASGGVLAGATVPGR